jgi:2-polyprenyl-6-methoxyphenol hydroxylase-like FAD-dependent oxidoreductase
MAHLADWHQLASSFLTVQGSRCRRWYRPGLLLIGDAAHTMTAGAGIKYAVEDAVVAANVLAEPLKAGRVRLPDLAAVQRRREIPTRFIQALGAFAQRNLIRRLLSPRGTLRPLSFFLLAAGPVLRRIFPRLLAFGLWKVRVKSLQSSPSPASCGAGPNQPLQQTGPA